MSYKRAEDVLPVEVIKLIQMYIDGENVYIPRKNNERKEWGHGTKIKQELRERNKKIYLDHEKGLSIKELACKYYLSEKSIERILRDIYYSKDEPTQ